MPDNGDKKKKGKKATSTVPAGRIQEARESLEAKKKLLKEGWNKYIWYLDSKGLTGDPRLNHAYGKQVFLDWANANPKYGLNWDTLPTVVDELQKQTQNIKGAVQAGRLNLNVPISDLNPSEAANFRSKNPAWPGVELTAQEFPTYEEFVLDPAGKVVKSQQYGIMPSQEKYLAPRIKP